MLLLAVALAFQTTPPKIARDAFGVPQIKAATMSEAFFQEGYATAEARMWQMEYSRRLARGRLAEVFGESYGNADKEVLKISYTDAELNQQYARLNPEVRDAFDSYVRGVNSYLMNAKTGGTLPAGYKDNGFDPVEWTKEDSMAIGVLLFQQFGRFGAGEIRNMALLAYLEGQPNAKDRKLDILGDFIWQNDPKAVPTVYPEDDSVKVKPVIFPPFDRTITDRHLAMLPKLGLFELLPGIRLAEKQESRRVAQLTAVPFKAGSYALIVGSKRSATGHPLLLSGPQMGFTTPSIVHEVALEAPGLRVAGMDVPGVPGVYVGATPYVSWGLTSGVADTDDVFFYKTAASDSYTYGTETRKLEKVERTLKIKGKPDQTVARLNTLHGPVVINSKSAVFVRRPASYGAELDSLNGVFDLYKAKNADQAEQAMSAATMNFNFFYATADGDVGYRYVGRIPLRAPGIDPRFPTPGDPQFDWRGMVAYDQMPHVRNPKGGLAANWNNKPAAWWPNGDSPVWGRVFRNTEVLAAADKKSLAPSDVEMVPWTIARRNETYRFFAPYWKRAVASGPEFLQAQASAYDGWAVQGSPASRLYNNWFASLREEIFLKTTGNFIDPQLFALAAQPTVILAALEKRTKVDYMQGRSVDQVARAAWEKALAKLGPDVSAWRLDVDNIAVTGQAPIPYSNRGTYIQIVQMGPWGAYGRNVLPPGETESGDHAFDQVPLARAWLYKSMAPLGK
ncbi:MAG: penicillin amidase [Fimbriimonadaceae bacterium]|jgi:penicillin amidase|nr:penicillin amidase [Fimbriimonadaceae bacterium]